MHAALHPLNAYRLDRGSAGTHSPLDTVYLPVCMILNILAD